MKISYNWLKWYIPEIPEAQKVADILTYHLTEVEGTDEKDGDTIFDINILPNRAGDLLSHLGVARELSGQLGIPLVDPTPQYKIPVSQPTKLEIDIQTDKCRRYMGRIIRNVSVGPSPEWVKLHLESIGQRSINNIVDATNLVMFNCGQPTHAFDLKKLASEKIVIKENKEEIKFPVVGSEKIEVPLKAGDIVISDSEKILALAGIKGGTNSGISIDVPYVTDIVLEVANFDPVSVRKTARRVGQLSDSAKRFENNVPIELATYAMLELCALIVEMCPDAVFESIIDEGVKKGEPRKVSFTTDIINEKLGLVLTPADISTILQNYRYEYLEENGSFIVNLPYWRGDITGIHDMVEEIGRVYGYDKVAPQIPKINFIPQVNEVFVSMVQARNKLMSEGYCEVMTYSFRNTGVVEVLASASDKKFLRTNLLDGLKESFELNKNNTAFLGIKDLKIFEIGTVFGESGEEMHIAWMGKKESKEMLLSEWAKENPQEVLPSLDHINHKLASSPFKMWSVYPSITRDVSFWSNKEMTEDTFIKIVEPVLGELTVRKPYLIDQFQKDGRYSYAFRFIFQSYEKTLTDNDVEGEWNKILDLIKKEGFEIR